MDQYIDFAKKNGQKMHSWLKTVKMYLKDKFIPKCYTFFIHFLVCYLKRQFLRFLRVKMTKCVRMMVNTGTVRQIHNVAE